MYFLFRYHNMTPTQFKQLKRGEKKILRSFMIKEIEDKNKEREQINGIFGGI